MNRNLIAFSIYAACVIALQPAVRGLAQEAVDGEPKRWDTNSDTWVATDALGRSLPTQVEVGAPRADKTVGIFYFLWLGQHGDKGPFDISKILTEDPLALQKPDSPLWGPIHAPHHWGESLFGYYVGDDEGVLRKHAQMLSDADVDMVVFDVTNQLTYPRSWQALCRVFDSARRQGNRVPQIAFLCPFWAPDKVVRELYRDLYSKQLYPELWFRWDGKPLILADRALVGHTVIQNKSDTPVELLSGHTLGQTFAVDKPLAAVGGSFPAWASLNSSLTMTLYSGPDKNSLLARRRVEKVVDNEWHMLELEKPLPPGSYYLEISDPQQKVGWWNSDSDVLQGGQSFADGQPVPGDRKIYISLTDEEDQAIDQFFTFRKPQPDYFAGPTGPEQWGWLEVYPQHIFYDKQGAAEQVTVGVGQNAVNGKLGVLSHPSSCGRSFHDGKEPGPEGQTTSGENFAEQWRRALELDPRFIFITGWNEWIAGRFDHTFPLAGSGPVTFCDQFNQEYSRDVEPMKGGHGDNYYYQMVSFIRRYKGVRAVPPVEPRPIAIDGQFDDWRDAAPEFRDTIGDPALRDHAGWNPELHYQNKTGRNDLIAAKVSFDEQLVYFYLRTQQPRSPADNLSGTTLLVDADSNPRTGWLGYDLMVNRQNAANGSVVIERNVDGRYEWSAPAQTPCRYAANEVELAIPRSMLGATNDPVTIDFKWCDNLQQTGDWSDFTLNGDVAPNDRFNYRAATERGR